MKKAVFIGLLIIAGFAINTNVSAQTRPLNDPYLSKGLGNCYTVSSNSTHCAGQGSQCNSDSDCSGTIPDLGWNAIRLKEADLEKEFGEMIRRKKKKEEEALIKP